MAFSAQRGKGRGNYSQRIGNNNFNSRERGFKPAGQETCPYNNKNRRGPQNNPSSQSHNRTIMTRVKFVVGITILLLSIFTGETTLTKPKMSYHK